MVVGVRRPRTGRGGCCPITLPTGGVRPYARRVAEPPISFAPTSGGVFICYRRLDSGGYALLIHKALEQRVGAWNLFLDVDHIGPGVDFVTAIERAVLRAGVMVVLIGRSWVGVQGAQRRIDDVNDFVRVEVRAALKARLPVLPVLVDEAPMPAERELPADIAALSRLNALRITHGPTTEVELGAIGEAVLGALRAGKNPDLRASLWISGRRALEGGTVEFRGRFPSGRCVSVSVKVPAKTSDGTVLRLRRIGETDSLGVRPGDLHLTIRIRG